jgi:hypothetical protein
MEALEDALTAAFGLNGRARKGGDPNERARKTLSTAIRRTLVHIKKENIDLWRQLKDFLDLGLFSSYHPRPQVNWTT